MAENTKLVEHGPTPGPWAWFGNAGSNSLYLATTHSGRRYVMGFKRWGFSGGQPQFQPEGRGLVDASKLLTFDVGDRDVRGVDQAKANSSVYRLDINGIDCADARLIAAAPDLLAALLALEDAQTALNDADEHSEQAEAEGWRNDPTGSGWVSESYNRASKLFDKATELRRAALIKASPRAGEGV